MEIGRGKGKEREKEKEKGKGKGRGKSTRVKGKGKEKSKDKEKEKDKDKDKEKSKDKEKDKEKSKTKEKQPDHGAPDLPADEPNVFRAAMARLSVYDILPESSKVVVLDTQLLVKDAFQVLVENNVRSAPLWDAEARAYTGLISMTDFIAVLKYFYRSPLAGMDELVEYSISRWRGLASSEPETKHRVIHGLHSVAPTDSLLDVATLLVEHDVHRAPVVEPETNTIFATLTHWDVLDATVASVALSPPYLDASITDLGVGVFKSVITVSPETPLIVVLNIFFERSISAVPIIDSTGVVLDIYSKSDVYDLARSQAYQDLDITVDEAIEYRAGAPAFHTASKHDSLASVIATLRATHAHRLICIDSTSRITGIVSLGDVLIYLLNPTPVAP